VDLLQSYGKAGGGSPVQSRAGRMPSRLSMNVLMAEVDIPYELLPGDGPDQTTSSKRWMWWLWLGPTM